MDEQTAKDFDETRRLLYGAIAARRTDRWELVGSLVNALVHHSKLVDDADDAMWQALELVDGLKGNELWATDLINRITQQLDA